MSALNPITWAALPTEVIEEVISSVDERKDLLPLKLTCKELQRLVQPHLEFWRISCTITESHRVWDLLAGNKHLCRKVRHVRIPELQSWDVRLPYRMEPSRLRRGMSWDVPNDRWNAELISSAKRLFLSAFRQMTRLLSFEWHARAPVIDFLADPHAKGITACLQSCIQLRSLGVNDPNGKLQAEFSSDSMAVCVRANVLNDNQV